MSDSAKTNDIVIYSTSWCSDCRRSRKFLDSLGITYTDVDIEEHPEAAEKVRELNHGNQSVPTILFSDGSTLVEPSNVALEEKLVSLGLTK